MLTAEEPPPLREHLWGVWFDRWGRKHYRCIACGRVIGGTLEAIEAAPEDCAGRLPEEG
jgi:hypothetical protein